MRNRRHRVSVTDFDASIHSGSIAISFFEEMSDALGEGFDGEEYDAQVNVVDPFQTRKIIRSAFLAWYTTLVEVAGEKGEMVMPPHWIQPIVKEHAEEEKKATNMRCFEQ